MDIWYVSSIDNLFILFIITHFDYNDHYNYKPINNIFLYLVFLYDISKLVFFFMKK